MNFPQLFSRVPDAFAGRFNPDAPWELLDEPLDQLLAGLPSSEIHGQLAPDVHLAGDRIVICPGARIHPTAVIEGPIYIGRGVEVRPGAYLRGGVWIGDHCVVGTNTEIKRAILLPHAKAPHLNYIGDSILGADVNLGAGTVLSNFRHDGGNIHIARDGQRIDTGRRKLGAILGDGVLTGCNSVLHPGVVVGRGTQIYPGVQLRPGVYPGHSVVKLRQELEVVPQRP
jgi:UDP-N-acetylglucosamine diphosphorylase / glucose-1-phosphate thymidylyltransferase / UDP-N-acetylgalactosamine diphosphorylase / glucosamine-1-phosphate N-acetyltransferase / galactosamine-1-phosphate N-acetyltransferase